MDEFKPEDELKPDTSDRRPSRTRKTSVTSETSVSRQHVMMGIGILVLLLLVFAIGSALNGPDKLSVSKPASGTGTSPAPGITGGNSGEKSIDLSGSSSVNHQGDDVSAPTAGQNSNVAPQELSVPSISATPTVAQPQLVPEGQQRVELLGDLNSALSKQQKQVNHFADGAQSVNSSGLPVAPATVAPVKELSAGRSTTAAKLAAATPGHTASHPTSPLQAAKPGNAQQQKRPISASGGRSVLHTLPSGHYTLQLSAASRPESLNSWAQKQQLSSYYVYRTIRKGKPWYVLVSGSYATLADARRAAAVLPAEVRAQNPWVKPVSQIKKEAN